MRSLLLGLLTCATALATHAAPFSVPGAGASFDAPAGFTALSKAELARKFPSTHAPAQAVGNERRTTTIAFDLKDQPLPPERLAEARTAMEQTMERIVPGIEWKQRRIVRMQGQDWAVLEITSRAVDTDIHNIVLATSRRGKMLLFNFNSTRGEFPSVESGLRRSIESIVLDAR